MGVDNLRAADLVVAVGGWQPMDTFPKDGTVVEITDASGFICRAQWNSERVLSASLNIAEPTGWRSLE
jgi:hypothetical protein